MVAFRDDANGQKTTVMRWNGSAWSVVGTPGISAGGTDSQSLALDAAGHPVVAFRDDANGGKTTVMRWNGSAWATVGAAGISAGAAYYQSLALDAAGNPVVAFRDDANGQKTTVMRWNGSAWSVVGTPGISAGGADFQSLALDASGDPVVAYRDVINGGRTTVQRWNGSNWVVVGTAGFTASVSSYSSRWLQVDAQGNMVVAYGSGFLYAKRYSSNSLSTGSVSGSFCANGSNFNMPFTAAAPFAGGNMFTAQLSDASGSFASPVAIGSLSATGSGSVPCAIPLGTPAGAGYRIRVVASAPSIMGTDNGADLTITAPTAWYADADGDGFGDAAADSMACAQPVGHVADNTDPCPLALPGIANFNTGNCACDPGYYATTTQVGSNTVITGCTICPPGNYCPDGLQQLPCAAGSYSSGSGAIACTLCQAGTFNAVPGATSCTTCPLGEASGEGATACVPGTDLWIQRANVGGNARRYAVGFSIGAKSFIGTGFDTAPMGDFWEYDPALDAWTQKADFGGTARYSAVGFSIGSKGYIGTGTNGAAQNDFWAYDPGTNSWTQKASFGGTARQGAVGFSIGTKGYLGTGNDGSNRNDFWEYDPATDTWTQRAAFGGTGRYWAVGFSTSAKGYIGTGYDGSNRKDFWEYDPGSDAWSPKADFGGSGRNSAVGFTIGGKGFIGTGYDGSNTSDFWEYNATSNTWVQKATYSGAPRHAATGFSNGTKGYIGTGSAVTNASDFWAYSAFIDLTCSVAGTSFCADGASTFSVSYSTSGLFNSGNTFVAQLSDATGGFTSPTAIGNVNATSSGSITCTIPLAIPPGTGYRVRVVSSDVAVTGTANTGSLTISMPTLWYADADGDGFGDAAADSTACGQPSGYVADNTDLCPLALSGIANFNTSSCACMPGYYPVTTLIGTNVVITGCTPCPPGTYCPDGLQQLPCAAGSYSGVYGAITCLLCPVGTFSAAPSATVCTACSMGQASGEGATGCVTELDLWTQRANVGGGTRRYAVGFSIGGLSYIGTGYDTAPMNDFWAYDPATDAWTQKADFGGAPRYSAVGFSIGNKGYIGTGAASDGNKRDLWAYDPATNTWTQKADFGGTARVYAVGFSIGDKGYIGTGSDGSNRNDFWAYDPGTDTWTQKANFGGSSRIYAVGLSIGDKGYIGTGHDGSNRNDFWAYNPATDSWAQMANFGGSGRNSATGFSIGPRGYIGTGYDGTNKNDFWAYDPAANTWTQKATYSGAPRHAAVGFSNGTKGYIGTGSAGSNAQDFWSYSTVAELRCSVASATFCTDGTSSFPVTYVTEGTYGGGNTFTAQLSDATGSFVSPTVIGSTNATASGTITCVLPALTPEGTGYRIRVVADNPAITGSANGSALSIHQLSLPSITASGSTSLCSGGSVTLAGSSASAWLWNTGATTQSIGVTSAGTYTLTATDADGCSGSTTQAVTQLPQPTPGAGWQKALGGTGSDAARDVWQTTDGGYLITGSSGSSDGDATANQGANDFWVVKTNATGSIQWQTSLGGSANEYITGAIQTSDGGYALAGSTESANLPGFHGSTDAWLVRLDPAGTVLWQRSFGTSGVDEAGAIVQAADGSLVFAGSTAFYGGDVSGWNGAADFLLVKLDEATGSTIWQRCLGTSYGERATGLSRTADGGFILCGYTDALAGTHGASDFNVMKTDGTGNLQWSQTYGGSAVDVGRSVLQLPSGDYVTAGHTFSSDDQVSGSHGGVDTWVVRLNSVGGIVWQRCLGGSADDYGGIVVAGAHNDVLMLGSTSSNNGDVTGFHGTQDAWLVSMSQADGTLNWQRALGGSGNDEGGGVRPTADGEIIVSATTASNDGDVSGHHGGGDMWLVKMNRGAVASDEPLAVCDGGPLTLTANTGSSYLWSTGATTQSITVSTAGSYSITVDGCFTSLPAVVTYNTPPDPPTISLSGANALCAGGSVVLTSSEASGNTWSTGATTSGITVNAPGSYTVTYTANGCSATSAPMPVVMSQYTTVWSENFEGPVYYPSGGWYGSSFGVVSGYPYNAFSVQAGFAPITNNTMQVINVTSSTSAFFGYGIENPGNTNHAPLIYRAVDATGLHSLRISYDWICNGEAGADYGQMVVYHPSTGWISWGPTLQGQTGVQHVVDLALPYYLSHTSFYIGWYFTSNQSVVNQPGLSVDNITVSGATYVLGHGTLSGPFCAGAPVSVPYDGCGYFGGGNIFTAQLSDASGSFASPVDIGSLSSSTAGTINAIIPMGTPIGSGYRIRIVSNNPAIIGADNGQSFTIHQLPTLLVTDPPATCGTGTVDLTAAAITAGSTNGLALTYWTDAAATGSYATPATASNGIYYIKGTDAAGCSDMGQVTAIISVPADAGADGALAVCANAAPELLIAALGGSPQTGGSWTGPSTVSGGAYDPSNMDPGAYRYIVTGTAPCPNDTGFVTVSEPQPVLWYADTDGDGYGDTVADSLDCDQPVGYVADGSDDCPSVFGRVGEPCDDGDANTDNDVLTATCACVGTPTAITVAARVILEGPYVSATGLMNDALRGLGNFPLTDPYPGLGYTHTGSGNSGAVAPAVVAVGGNDAIVDWVLLELRSTSNPATILASRSCLVQRDGDVVDLDGTSPVSFTMAAGNYYVAMRHRNHLGCMTIAPVAVAAAPVAVNFTTSATVTYGTAARKSVGGAVTAEVLWAGDVTFNGQVKYTGTGNDRDPILTTVGSTTPNNTVSTYSTRDVNMNGQVKYTGSGNDRDPILVNVGSTTPNNVRVQQLP